MKRLGMCFDRLMVTNSRQYITAYETWSYVLHASYTLDRYKQLDKWVNGPPSLPHTLLSHLGKRIGPFRTLATAAFTPGRPTLFKYESKTNMNNHIMQFLGKQNNQPTRSTQYPTHHQGWPTALGLARTTHLVPTVSNIVHTICSVHWYFQ